MAGYKRLSFKMRKANKRYFDGNIQLICIRYDWSKWLNCGMKILVSEFFFIHLCEDQSYVKNSFGNCVHKTVIKIDWNNVNNNTREKIAAVYTCYALQVSRQTGAWYCFSLGKIEPQPKDWIDGFYSRYSLTVDTRYISPFEVSYSYNLNIQSGNFVNSLMSMNSDKSDNWRMLTQYSLSILDQFTAKSMD